MDWLNRIRLLFGDDAIDKLKHSTVMVVGCGAVGSFAVEALARSGIGHLIIIDSDKVESTNINRQLFALNSTIGLPKVDVARNRILDINPDAQVDALNMFFDKNSDIDVRPCFVIDAIDTVPSKIALYQWCTERKIPFISSMGAAQKTDLSKIKIAPISKTSVCPLASKIRHEIKTLSLPDFPAVFSTQSPTHNDGDDKHIYGSVITVTGAFGLYLANHVIDYLITK
ncbi:MAG: tRNA threonylcarbamoyladenosine dehydratase [Alphaproteobacteria bacterium]|nr:tRNA threonylcarbamoyladenosine dehydratase [Alphaproteobacteria bacterium]